MMCKKRIMFASGMLVGLSNVYSMQPPAAGAVHAPAVPAAAVAPAPAVAQPPAAFPLPAVVPPPAPPAPEEAGWMNFLSAKIQAPVIMLNTHQNLFNLIEALMHIPYIITVDSTDPHVIKICASLCAASTATKVTSILLGEPVLPLIALSWHAPKLLCYLLGGSYDAIRFLDAAKVAYKNRTDAAQLKGFKFNQLMQLCVEIFLRVMAIMSSRQELQGAHHTQALATWATELADVVSILRLVTRYTTYFRYTESFEFHLVINKKELGLEDEMAETEKEIEQMAAIADEYYKVSEQILAEVTDAESVHEQHA